MYHLSPFLNRHYFALPTNPGEQFFMFCTLAAWLISKAGHPFEQPQEDDDPNAVISHVLSELRSFVSVTRALCPRLWQTAALPSGITAGAHCPPAGSGPKHRTGFS